MKTEQQIKEDLEFYDYCKQSRISDVSGSSLSVFLDYEIRSSWWASWIGWDWGQELSGRYFAWKASRKYARYKQSKMWEQRIKNLR